MAMRKHNAAFTRSAFISTAAFLHAASGAALDFASYTGPAVKKPFGKVRVALLWFGHAPLRTPGFT
jgi:hypothetical protein